MDSSSMSVIRSMFLCLAYQISQNVVKSSNITTTIVPNSTQSTISVGNPFLPANFKGITFRAIYVIAAVSGVIVVYFVVRAICSRRRRSRTRRYGILNNESRDHMEMRPLSEADDDDDDDLTLFDMSKRKGKR